jgi:putative protease
VIWPENEKLISDWVQAAIQTGARRFVLNAAWQIGFFKYLKGLDLWAGPFCNLANPLAIAAIKTMGFNGAIVSPELSGEDFLQLPLQSSIPLGIVLTGNWPLCVARSITPEIQLGKPFVSPRGEEAWATRYGPDFWIYPNWKLDLASRKKALQKAGYCLVVNLIEPLPKHVKLKKRQAVWNWKHSLG